MNEKTEAETVKMLNGKSVKFYFDQKHFKKILSRSKDALALFLVVTLF